MNGRAYSGLIVARIPPAMPQAPCASERVARPRNSNQEWDKPLIRYARKIWTGTDALKASEKSVERGMRGRLELTGTEISDIE